MSVVAALWGRKNPIPRSWRIPAWCAVIAVATAAAAVLATVSVAGWNPTVLVRMAEEQELAPLARAADPDFVFVHYHGRGDGVSVRCGCELPWTPSTSRSCRSSSR